MEREYLAGLESIKRFRCYIEMQEISVVTDHKSLVWLMRQPNFGGRQARWGFQLQSFKFTVSPRKGRDHTVLDALSRIKSGEISNISIIEPEVDLNSPHFEDEEYRDLRKKKYRRIKKIIRISV